jgi:NAD(P)-dependent dehydrogenase (short-subunit alcohol dehydrogenase family)
MRTKLVCLLPLLCIALRVSSVPCNVHSTSTSLVHERRYDLSGKVAVMTGSDGSGIGYGGALGFATANATLILLSHRPASRGADAARRIQLESGNDKIHVIGVDLASLTSVRAAAAAIVDISPRVDVLVCSAGVNEPPPDHALTEDGLEFVFQAHCSHLLHPSPISLFAPHKYALRVNHALGPRFR